MADIRLMNLVTTRLVQDKKEVEYHLTSLLDPTSSKDEQKVSTIIKTLDDYSNIINKIKLWESLIDDISVPEGKENGDK